MAKKDAKQSAVEVRTILKSTYHDTTFSVRSKHYAGGSSVDIRWTDGPAPHEVSKLTAHLKGYDNSYYNEYIGVARTESREVMEAVARAAAKHYGVPVPEIVGGDHPYCEDWTSVGFGLDHKEPICDKIHRAARSTSVYDVDLAEAFAEAFPC